jgi:hypothetical protein
MSDFLAPWVKIQRQMLDAHKSNVDQLFRQMNKTGFDGATKAARDVHDAQVVAWEKWLALWGPKGE